MNNILRSANTDFVSAGSSGNTIINMTFNSTSFPTMASFTYSGDINVNSANAIASPEFLNVSRYLKHNESVCSMGLDEHLIYG